MYITAKLGPLCGMKGDFSPKGLRLGLMALCALNFISNIEGVSIYAKEILKGIWKVWTRTQGKQLKVSSIITERNPVVT